MNNCRQSAMLLTLFAGTGHSLNVFFYFFGESTYIYDLLEFSQNLRLMTDLSKVGIFSPQIAKIIHCNQGWNE